MAADDGDLDRMDGIADGNFPYMDHFALRRDTIFADNAASTSFGRKNSPHWLGIFVACANYQIVHLDRCLSWQNAVKIKCNSIRID